MLLWLRYVGCKICVLGIVVFFCGFVLSLMKNLMIKTQATGPVWCFGFLATLFVNRDLKLVMIAQKILCAVELCGHQFLLFVA